MIKDAMRGLRHLSSQQNKQETPQKKKNPVTLHTIQTKPKKKCFLPTPTTSHGRLRGRLRRRERLRGGERFRGGSRRGRACLARPSLLAADLELREIGDHGGPSDLLYADPPLPREHPDDVGHVGTARHRVLRAQQADLQEPARLLDVLVAADVHVHDVL